jgi:putative ABC transport system ATP-binding protein
MSVIEIRDLTKVYNSDKVPVQALNGITLNINQGEFTAIVGPSGSGKTTLLNILGGLDEPTSGSVMINGTNLWKMNQSQLSKFRLHHIGFVFQAYNLIPVLTAKENIAFILQIQGHSTRECHEKAMAMLEAVGIAEQADKRPSEMSGGQQQRVAVARALASKPDFVLADEPTANLDSKSASNLLEIMEQLNHQEGMTFVFSTHDQRVVERAHRIITMVDGLIATDINQPHV